ncbi:MAG: NAD(P)H-hydrate dehydratase [Bacteroidetes bacterium]|nr:NAD(P)H-hydrate dehydratase [Bacteroidota bacterium]
MNKMKILTADQTRQADAYTIEHEPVASINLMERAAAACFEWITQHVDHKKSFKIFCGTGNNGGDGLAIAGMLLSSGFQANVFIIATDKTKSNDFIINEIKLAELFSKKLRSINNENEIPFILEEDVVIDAIFGTGLSRLAEGLYSKVIQQINESKATVIAIDMPSGLFADVPADHSSPIIKATHTLSFQSPKFAFLFPENEPYVGRWEILDIHLNQKFIDGLPGNNFLLLNEDIKAILKPRRKFSHKGMYGHALLVAGSFGKMGAAVLAAKACLGSGAGLLTVHIPTCGYEILQRSFPEAMVETDEDENMFTSKLNSASYSAVGIGCGIGTHEKTKTALADFLSRCKVPVVLDADAINIIGMEKSLLDNLPLNSILTPHPKEFERIAGKTENDFERHGRQVKLSKEKKIFIVLKGAHTCITCPDGKVFFNSTGNPGMAKGGSGDALTGIILSFLAQGYSAEESCKAGVYLHGLAGDFAAKEKGEASMLASDLIENLGKAFTEISGGE